MVFKVGVNDVISVISRRPLHLPMLYWNSLNSALHNKLSKALAAFPHNSAETVDSCEGGMNPNAMTIINPRKEYWPSPGTERTCSVKPWSYSSVMCRKDA